MHAKLVLVAGLACALGAAAHAQVIDGTRDAAYGSPVVIQRVQTQFGDANPGGGSELNAAYARIDNGRLYLMFTGNQETNFNKLNVYIDSIAGGENVLTNTPQYDFNNVSQNQGGMTFDTGFNADFHLYSRWGNASGPYEVDFVNRQGGGSAMVPGAHGVSPNAVGLVASGVIPAGALAPNASGSSLTQPLKFAINNNNLLGVTGGTGAADPAAAAAVSTGMEFSLALADLGNPALGDVILIAAMIGNGDHNYLSNQILGGLPADTGNLGGNGTGGFTGTLSGVNFNQFEGLQYFGVRLVPAPGSLALLGLGGLAALRRRRA